MDPRQKRAAEMTDAELSDYAALMVSRGRQDSHGYKLAVAELERRKVVT